MVAETTPIEVFFSYSHEDKALLTQLLKHLRPLEREGVIKGWNDQDLVPAEEWDAEIKSHLKSAGIILLLVSADFLDSKYIWETELKTALERHAAGTASVVPVILRPCDWQRTDFAKLQALPTSATPVTKWPDRDEAFLSVAQGMRRVAQAMAARAKAGTTSSATPGPAAASFKSSIASDAPGVLAASTPAGDDPVRLYELLNDRFSQDELADLCMRLGLDWDNLAGGTKSGKARELVGYLRRRNRLPDLVQAIRRVRPDVPV